MGAKRSYAAVAREVGVSKSTVKNWARAFRWQLRLEARQAYDNQILVDQTDEALKERTERAKKILDVAILQLAKLLSEGCLRASSRDLPRLERLKARLDRWQDHQKAGGSRRAVFILPDNGRDEPGWPSLHKSQVDDFLASLRRE